MIRVDKRTEEIVLFENGIYSNTYARFLTSTGIFPRLVGESSFEDFNEKANFAS